MKRELFVGGAIALPLALQRAAEAQTPGPAVRIGANLFDSYASSLYAKEEGFFVRAGLNADVQVVGNGAAMAAAVSSGALDIGISVPDRIANAYVHGFPFVILAEGNLTTDKIHAAVLCVAKTSPLKTAKDFEGKTVAVNALKTASELTLDTWLAQGGVDPAKVKVIESNYSDMGPQIQRGTIDAGIIAEPALSVALRQNEVRVLVDPGPSIAARYINSCWFSTRDFAQRNSDAVARFCRAIYAAQRWANTHLAERAAIIARYSKSDPNQVSTMVFSPFAERLRIAEIQPLLDAGAKYGTIAHQVSAAEIVFQP